MSDYSMYNPASVAVLVVADLQREIARLRTQVEALEKDKAALCEALQMVIGRAVYTQDAGALLEHDRQLRELVENALAEVAKAGRK